MKNYSRQHPKHQRARRHRRRAGRLLAIFEEIFNNKEKAAAGKGVMRNLITGQPINKEQP